MAEVENQASSLGEEKGEETRGPRRKAGRPPGPRKKGRVVSFLLSPTTLAQLDAIRAAYSLPSRTAALERAVAQIAEAAATPAPGQQAPAIAAASHPDDPITAWEQPKDLKRALQTLPHHPNLR